MCISFWLLVIVLLRPTQLNGHTLYLDTPFANPLLSADPADYPMPFIMLFIYVTEGVKIGPGVSLPFFEHTNCNNKLTKRRTHFNTQGGAR